MDNLCVPSAVSPSYAPAGQALISATVVGAAGAEEKNLEAEVRRHLASWFGIEVADWKRLAPTASRWPCRRARAWSRRPSPSAAEPGSTSAAITGRRRPSGRDGFRTAGGGGGDRGMGREMRATGLL